MTIESSLHPISHKHFPRKRASADNQKVIDWGSSLLIKNQLLSLHFRLWRHGQENIRGTFQAPLTGQKSHDFQPLSRHIFRPICPVVSDSFFILLVCFLLPISITDPALSSMIFPAHSSCILPLEGFGDILFLWSNCRLPVLWGLYWGFCLICFLDTFSAH